MSKIQANSSGTRTIEVSEEHLQTLEKYQLMREVQESHGYVNEETLNKLKLNIRALLFVEWKNRGNDNLGMTSRAFQGTPFN